MATSTNNGNQAIYFNYHKALTGDIMNKANHVINKVGVLSGLEITKASNSTVSIAEGFLNISDGGNRTILIHKQSSHTISVDGSSEYIVARYNYSETELWFASFINVATPSSNDVILGKILYNSGNVDSIDYSHNVITDGRRVNDQDIFITAGGRNQYFKELIESGVFGPEASGNNWLDTIQGTWVSDEDEAPAQEFDTIKNRYLYFFIKTGSAVDIKFLLKYTGDVSSPLQVRLKLDYIVLTNGMSSIDDITFENTNYENIIMSDEANEFIELQTSTFKVASAASSVSNKLILCRMSRDYSHASDTYQGNFQLIQMIPTAG
jgi:hypothetical protein